MTTNPIVPSFATAHDHTGGSHDYGSARPETQQQVDEIIAAFDPADIQAAMVFGNAPLERVGQLAKDLLGQKDSLDHLKADLQTAFEGFSDLDLGELSRAAMETAVKTAKAVGPKAGAGGIIGFLAAGPLGALLGAAAGKGVDVVSKRTKMSPEERRAEELMQSARSSIAKVGQLETRLKDAQKIIPQLLEQTEAMGAARIESFRELQAYIIAAQMLRAKYESDFLPEAAARYAETGDVEDHARLENITLAQSIMDQRIVDLVSAQTIDMHSTVMLSDSRRMLVLANTKITSHLQTSLPMWRGQALQADMAGTALQIAVTLNEADRHGGKMLAETVDLANTTRGMITESLQRGAFDPAAVIDATKKLAASMGSVDQLMVNSAQREKALAGLLEAQGELARAVEKSATGMAARIGYSGAQAPALGIRGPRGGGGSWG